MSIEVTCDQCGAVHHVNQRLVGRRVRCPHCDALVTVPAAADGRDTEVLSDDVAAASGVAGPRHRSGAEPVAAGEHAEALDAKFAFGSDPVFDTAPKHSATDMPAMPAVLADEDDDEPPRRGKRKEDELDMTPMVDVTFLLLIFFMVTASFSLQKSLEMPRQQSDLPSTEQQDEEEEEEDVITVQIDEFGSFLVLASDWERETPGKQNLITALREGIAQLGGSAKLAVEVHEDAKLKYLVDCMDAGAICGYNEVQVTQVDGFDF